MLVVLLVASRCDNGFVLFWLAVVLCGALGVLLLTGAIYQARGVRADARRLPPPGRLIDIGGRRLHLHCLGDGPVSVVFESGLGASSLNWRPVQEAVAGFARACAYDRAGYGWSDRASGLRSARAAAADLRRLLQAAEVPPPYVLVAHSFGSYVAPVFAATHPEEVAGLVLIDPITPDDWLTPDAAQRRRVRGGRLFCRIGALLASVGLVRFLLNRVRPAKSVEAVPADVRRSAAAGAAPSATSSLPAAVLALFGREADAVVRRLVGEVTKMPRVLWPAVRAHWSRPASFLTLAQHFDALSPSAAEVQAACAPESATGRRLQEIPLIVVSAAHCTEERIACHRQVAARSRDGSHRLAAAGGHWVQFDDPTTIVDAVHRLAERVVFSGQVGPVQDSSPVDTGSFRAAQRR